MNDRKIEKLFAAARRETAPEPPFTFARDTLTALRMERNRATEPAPTLFDQLGLLFPRLAWAAATVIVLCVAAEAWNASQGATLSNAAESVKETWLFAAN